MRRVDCAVVRLPGVVGAIAAREALRAGKPYLAEVVGDVLEALWTNGNPKGKLAALPMYVVNRRYITGAPFATYVTRTTLQRRYPPSGEWVNASNVIVDAPRPEVLARRLARIEASDPAAPPLLGLVGSYDVDYKGHETALRAMAVLQRDGFAVRLRCIGVGDPSRWRARARALGVNDSVELDGPLPHGAAVMAWMDALDLCIAPSLTEGLPRAVVEAMSRALPAIGARAGGIPELLEDRMLHAPKDHRALARLVRGLATGRAEMQRQARRNWEAAAEYAAGVIERRRDALFARFRAAAEEAARARGSKGAGCRPDRLAQSDARGS